MVDRVTTGTLECLQRVRFQRLTGIVFSSRSKYGGSLTGGASLFNFKEGDSLRDSSPFQEDNRRNYQMEVAYSYHLG